MERKEFYQVPKIPVSELLLDPGNPRIRHAPDQKECIARILRKSKNFINLLRDIAKNGLSIEHIVVSRNSNGKWIVRDGNRRITALQLLIEPERCPDPALKKQIESIIKKNPNNLITHVGCITSDNEKAILRYIDLKHTGVNEGIGQDSWSSMTKSIFNVSHGFSDPNKRAVQLIFWAENQGIRIDDTFPITNLNRMLNQKTLKIIGFEIQNDELVPIIDTESARRIVDRIISDFASNAINVSNIFTPDAQINYATKIRSEVSPEDFDSTNSDTGDDSDETGNTEQEEQTTSEDEEEQKNQKSKDGNRQQNSAESGSQPRRVRAPKKPSWDRTCIFPKKNPGFSIPEEHSKARNIITELRNLKVDKTPIAVAILLRALIELSEEHYRKINGLGDKGAFNKNIAAAATKMKQCGNITSDQEEVILRRTRQTEDLLHVTTLHKYVHSPAFHPSMQTLNTFWDEIGFFVAKCWQE